MTPRIMISALGAAALCAACGVGVVRLPDGTMLVGCAIGHSELSVSSIDRAAATTPTPTTVPATPASGGGLLALLTVPTPTPEAYRARIAGGPLSTSFLETLGTIATAAFGYLGLH
jgi:hypothetical protein